MRIVIEVDDKERTADLAAEMIESKDAKIEAVDGGPPPESLVTLLESEAATPPEYHAYGDSATNAGPPPQALVDEIESLRTSTPNNEVSEAGSYGEGMDGGAAPGD